MRIRDNFFRKTTTKTSLEEIKGVFGEPRDIKYFFAYVDDDDELRISLMYEFEGCEFELVYDTGTMELTSVNLNRGYREISEDHTYTAEVALLLEEEWCDLLKRSNGVEDPITKAEFVEWHRRLASYYFKEDKLNRGEQE